MRRVIPILGILALLTALGTTVNYLGSEFLPRPQKLQATVVTTAPPSPTPQTQAPVAASSVDEARIESGNVHRVGNE